MSDFLKILNDANLRADLKRYFEKAMGENDFAAFRALCEAVYTFWALGYISRETKNYMQALETECFNPESEVIEND